MKSLLFCLLPLSLLAQEVKPVLSPDYLVLVSSDCVSNRKSLLKDSTVNAPYRVLQYLDPYTGYSISRIRIKNGTMQIKPADTRILTFTGNYTMSAEIKGVNRTPHTQQSFVQGRAINGLPVWQGPETGELFSYGPLHSSLEYDGSNYDFDQKGKLVPAGSGTGQKSIPYNNSLLRTGSRLAHFILLQGNYYMPKGKWLAATFKLGKIGENTIIPNNRNKSFSLNSTLQGNFNWLGVTTAFNSYSDRYTFGNRNGYLNRAYAFSLLTPSSFENSQGTIMGNGQRSYSANADNPLFLLQNNDNGYEAQRRTASLLLEKKKGSFLPKLFQSWEWFDEENRESYLPGTAWFPAGIYSNRLKHSVNYQLRASAVKNIDYSSDALTGKLSGNYILSNNKTSLYHQPASYLYKRTAQDFALTYMNTLDIYPLDAGLNLGNKLYYSSTSTSFEGYLPEVSAYVRFKNVLDRFFPKLAVSYSEFVSEPPVSQSFNQVELLALSSDKAWTYFPQKEVGSFRNLNAVHHTERKIFLEIEDRQHISFRAELFDRKAHNDVFPVFENGEIVLRNLASHRNKGMELSFNYYTNRKNLKTDQTISFFRNRTEVTGINSSEAEIPLAGFSDIHTSLVKGQAVGVITGSRFLRNGDNKVVIGNDGFPLVDPSPAVIGNPQPDFTMKLSHMISWKKLALNFDLEWRKGGEVWNGTQAVLDYYGRSQNSGFYRNTTGYIFDGVLQDGHTNNIPVSFYDPAEGIENSRWVRYGFSGVGEEYIQKGDMVRMNSMGLSYKIESKRYFQHLTLMLYARNIILWTAYKGADPNNLLFDQSGSNGLDFFNLPSTKNFGFNLSLQF